MLLLVLLVLSVMLGAYLRFGAVAGTMVIKPYRADASEYYRTAYNLRQFGVYSQQIKLVDGQEQPPAPDAIRPPGYPLFLALFVDRPPDAKVFSDVEVVQAFLSVITLVLVGILMFRIATPWVACATLLFTAISPHIVNVSVFMVSETLFMLLLMAFFMALVAVVRNPTRFLPWLFGAGLLLGMATLTRPILELFPLVLAGLLFMSYPRREALKGSAALVLGFILVLTPWTVRNYISTGRSGDSSIMLSTLSGGMYPDFEYEHDPASRGEPYRFDPRTAEINSSLGSVVKEIAHHFEEHPAEELKWYLVGKPLMLWSWDMFAGGNDTFIYPVVRSPYYSSPVYVVTHILMYNLHWPLVALAALGCLFVWLPALHRHLEPGPLLLARSCGLLLLYNTAILMVMAPYVRYSIPFLPLEYGMAALAVYLLVVEARRMAAERRTAAP
ncbi:MAG TPA: glycosyltransferase family 39 protein [Gammaproteobacteria bacterium]|jgi:hypothetical protein